MKRIDWRIDLPLHFNSKLAPLNLDFEDDYVWKWIVFQQNIWDRDSFDRISGIVRQKIEENKN